METFTEFMQSISSFNPFHLFGITIVFGLATGVFFISFVKFIQLAYKGFSTFFGIRK
ncbi:MAG: hypothetical protein QG628_98 [Patescibacteria group bacterium]|nr:hypothetical protein [Patescibacteria group bacterium]